MTRPLSLLLWHLGRRGGGPRYTLELARSLMLRDDVRLSLALSRQSELFAETKALGLPTLAIRTYQSAGGFAASFLRLPAIRAQLAGFIAEQQADIALCSMSHLWNPLLVGPIRQAGAKNALVVHDAAPHPGDEQGLRILLMRQDFRQADLLISLTGAVRRRLMDEQGISPQRIIASKLGPFRYGGAALAPRQLSAGPFRLLFFGRLLPYKGFDSLIEAMRLLRREGFPAHLRLVGQGPVEFGDLPDNVTLERRWVAEQEVPALFADCDLVVLPYQEASQSGVLPIAQHMGVPALVTPVGGLLEQVAQGETGFLANDVTAAGLAQTISRVLSDRPSYNAMSRRLLQQGSDGQWVAIAEDLAGELRKAIGLT